MEKVYIITIGLNENYTDFCTRLANEIQTMKCKIVKMYLDWHGCDLKAIITYVNL